MDDRPYFSDLHQAWFFYDELGDTMGPYSSYKKAMRAYDNYCHFLDNGGKWWWYVLYFVSGKRYVPF